MSQELDPAEAVPVDHGPPDSYHPIYDGVVEWLDGERQTRPDTITPNRRRTPGPTKGRVKT